MDFSFSTAGALIGLIIAIILIVLKFQSTYSLIIGAFIGGIVGGGGLTNTVSAMISGSESMTNTILRILTSGILAGSLVKTGVAEKIADTIIRKLGEKRAILSIAISTLIICAVGVFIDISVITIAPIALEIAHKLKINKSSVLISMIGGGKAGNIISPNPNTIATASAFNIELTDLTTINIIPAIVALIVTVIIALSLSKKNGDSVLETDLEKAETKELPLFAKSIIGPICVIVLLALRPLFDINVDPLIALPVGGFVTTIVTGNIKNTKENFTYGFSKVIGVCALLIGTGTIAGIIKSSYLQQDMLNLIDAMNVPAFILAPLSGFLMAAATASTTAGATVASETFAATLIAKHINPISAGAMLHSSATIVDSLPHGSFFHATAGSVNLDISKRLKLIPYEALIGLSSTIASVLVYIFVYA